MRKRIAVGDRVQNVFARGVQQIGPAIKRAREVVEANAPDPSALRKLAILPKTTRRTEGEAGAPSALVNARLAGKAAIDPFAKIAALGNYSGLIDTAMGPMHVDVLQSSNPKAGPPLMFFGGISYATERFIPWASLFNKLGGPTLVLVALPGQGGTLARSIEDGRERSAGDRSPADQAKAAIAVLDALGVNAPINVGGLSYGAMIAMQAKADHPERFGKLLVMEPYVPAEGRDHDSAWSFGKAMMDNPFNPIGQAFYRATVRTQVAQTLGQNCPKFLEGQKSRYIDALVSMVEGADEFRVKETLERMPDEVRENTHFFLQKGSSANAITAKAISELGVKIGSYTAVETPAHDVITRDPIQSSFWAALALVGETAVKRMEALTLELKKAAAEREKAAAEQQAGQDAAPAG